MPATRKRRERRPSINTCMTLSVTRFHHDVTKSALTSRRHERRRVGRLTTYSTAPKKPMRSSARAADDDMSRQHAYEAAIGRRRGGAENSQAFAAPRPTSMPCSPSSLAGGRPGRHFDAYAQEFAVPGLTAQAFMPPIIVERAFSPGAPARAPASREPPAAPAPEWQQQRPIRYSTTPFSTTCSSCGSC